jgi:NADH:ubiquinone oxidoreductase subunit
MFNVTSKSWIIANFEIVIFWFVEIIGLLVIFGYDLLIVGINGMAIIILLWIFLSSIMGALIIPTKNQNTGIGKYIFFIIVGIIVSIVLISVLDDIDKVGVRLSIEFGVIGLWILFILASVFGVIIANYAHEHFNEVVSRQILYRNSNVDIFEKKWRYVLARGCSVATSIFLGMLWFVAIIYFLVIAPNLIKYYLDKNDWDKEINKEFVKTEEKSVDNGKQQKDSIATNKQQKDSIATNKQKKDSIATDKQKKDSIEAEKTGEDFFAFIRSFASDQDYQLSRIRFPLKSKSKDEYVSSQKDNWLFLGTDIIFSGKKDFDDKECEGKFYPDSEGKYTYKLERVSDSAVILIMGFFQINGEWRLTEIDITL